MHIRSFLCGIQILWLSSLKSPVLDDAALWSALAPHNRIPLECQRKLPCQYNLINIKCTSYQCAIWKNDCMNRSGGVILKIKLKLQARWQLLNGNPGGQFMWWI